MRVNTNLTEVFEFNGRWWQPKGDSRQVSGTLKYSPEKGAVLLLNDLIIDPASLLCGINPDIVLGITEQGEKITLYNCYGNRWKRNMPGYSTSLFYFDTILIGYHLKTVEQLRFTSISVWYPNLEAWSGCKVYTIKENRINYRPPDPIRAKIEDKTIVLESSFNTTDNRPGELILNHSSYIKIEWDKFVKLEDLKDFLYHINNFFTFAQRKAVFPIKIRCCLEVHDNFEEQTTEVDLLYKIGERRDLTKSISPQDMLFTSNDIHEQFEVCLQNWVKKAEILEPVYDLFFGTLYSGTTYLETKFLMLVQAVEAFHRRVIKTVNWSEDEHKKKVDEILDSISENDREWVNNCLRYGYELTLRQRLKELYDKYCSMFEDYFGNKKDITDKICVTRNYLTHYNEELKERAAQGDELYNLIMKLWGLLTICLLNEMGLDEVNIKKIMERHLQV